MIDDEVFYIATDNESSYGLSGESFTDAFEELEDQIGSTEFTDCEFYIARKVEVEMKVIPKEQLVPVEAPPVPRRTKK